MSTDPLTYVDGSVDGRRQPIMPKNFLNDRGLKGFLLIASVLISPIPPSSRPMDDSKRDPPLPRARIPYPLPLSNADGHALSGISVRGGCKPYFGR